MRGSGKRRPCFSVPCATQGCRTPRGLPLSATGFLPCLNDSLGTKSPRNLPPRALRQEPRTWDQSILELLLPSFPCPNFWSCVGVWCTYMCMSYFISSYMHRKAKKVCTKMRTVAFLCAANPWVIFIFIFVLFCIFHSAALSNDGKIS